LAEAGWKGVGAHPLPLKKEERNELKRKENAKREVIKRPGVYLLHSDADIVVSSLVKSLLQAVPVLATYKNVVDVP